MNFDEAGERMLDRMYAQRRDPELMEIAAYNYRPVWGEVIEQATHADALRDQYPSAAPPSLSAVQTGSDEWSVVYRDGAFVMSARLSAAVFEAMREPLSVLKSATRTDLRAEWEALYL